MNYLNYIWQSGKKRRVMHIAKFTQTGQMLMEALCSIRLPFDRSINAPWALGRKVCKQCLAIYWEEQP